MQSLFFLGDAAGQKRPLRLAHRQCHISIFSIGQVCRRNQQIRRGFYLSDGTCNGVYFVLILLARCVVIAPEKNSLSRPA